MIAIPKVRLSEALASVISPIGCYALQHDIGPQTDIHPCGILYFALGDQVGSTNVVVDASGTKVSELRYTAWGEVRSSTGTTPTDRTYTGQRSYTGDFGLMYYNARWYN